MFRRMDMTIALLVAIDRCFGDLWCVYVCLPAMVYNRVHFTYYYYYLLAKLMMTKKKRPAGDGRSEESLGNAHLFYSRG